MKSGLYSPQRHHRRSIRLKGYDYAQAGMYFITICCHDRACLFGEVIEGKMVLSEAGRVADGCWRAIPDHFPHGVLYEYVVMPNHVHGIIELTGASEGKTHAFQKMIPRSINAIVKGFKIGVTKWFRYGVVDGIAIGDPDANDGAGADNVSVGTRVGAENFLPLRPTIDDTTADAGFIARKSPIWQRNFYEHVIRNEQEFQRIAEYILHNPENWEKDKFHP